MRRILVVCVLISFVLNSFSQDYIYPTSLTITGYEGPIEEGSTLQLQAIPTPSNTTYDIYKWSSSKTSVATVDDNGLVTAVCEGTATITCLLTVANPGYFAVPNEQTATCIITVKKKSSNIITFVDSEAKRICVENWDTDNDGELSYAEAAAVTDIGDEFYGNESITTFDELVYFTSITSIGEEAFRSCTNLTSITIPNSVTLIDGEAFRNCPSLTAITIPQNVTSIGRCPFSECTSLTTMVVDSRNTKFDSREGCNAIIETASNTLVTGCDYTTIPSSVISIGEEAFRNCIGMTSINIPNSVISIGEYAFGNCTSLISVTIPNQITSISFRAFYYCTSLASIIIPNSVKSIVSKAFENCMNLTSVRIEIKNPLSIDGNTFPNRANATLYVPYGSRIDYLAANYWKEFKEIIELEPQSSDIINFADAEVKRICVQKWDTNNDQELSFAEAAAVTSLSSLFRNNSAITSFNELAYFTGLTSTDVYAFEGCSNLVSVTIPNTLKTLGGYAFSGCSSLTSITIPNSVRTIDSFAFYECI